VLRVIAYTGGHNAPARVPRVQSYVPHLRQLGIEITEHASRAGLYPPDSHMWLRSAWGLWNLAEHVPAVMRSYAYHVTLLQREMLSTFLTLEPFTKRPRVLDVDDAIWVHRGGSFARRLASLCDHVICGNRFLASQFSSWNPSVSVLPTAVDTARFVPLQLRQQGVRHTIGWLGLSSGFHFLYAIEPALRTVLDRDHTVKLRIVSNKPPNFSSLPQQQVEFVPYHREHEVAEIQAFTIGIMPLDQSVPSQGKCSFKMLQYMACGVPVMVSRYGMNTEVLAKGEIGIGACTLKEWVDGLHTLLGNPDLRRRLGENGRLIAERDFSTQVLAPQLAETLFEVAKPYLREPAPLCDDATE
jgi:glycosyltransferase involved in cell wall biosynthesis